MKLQYLTLQVPSDPLVWELYSDLLSSCVDDTVKRCDLLKRGSAAAAQKQGWERETNAAEGTIRIAGKYAKGEISLKSNFVFMLA